MLAMLAAMADDAPRPISIIAMTAATPMMMPRQVRAERNTFRRRAMVAVRRVLVVVCMGVSGELGGRERGVKSGEV